MRLRNFCIALGLLVMLPGCSALRPLFPHPKKPRPGDAQADNTPTPQRVGTVAMVNHDLKFVLVDVGSLYTPPAGTALKSFNGQQETSILAVDPEKQRPFVVADIIKGDPKVGDEVRE